jgi:hypothetical protein
MTRTARTAHTAHTARTFAAAVVAALALCATATAGGPTLSSGYGCGLACIESAIVTPTASSATVEVKTSVPASVTVKASKVDAQVGLAAGPAPRDIVLPAFQTIRTVLLPGLEPATTYRIVVSARDMQGRVYTRAGTFTTREVKVAVGQPDLGLSAGLGCKADCIQLQVDPDSLPEECRAFLPLLAQQVVDALELVVDGSPRLLGRHEWAGEGIAALERLLAAHAAFDAYLAGRLAPRGLPVARQGRGRRARRRRRAARRRRARGGDAARGAKRDGRRRDGHDGVWHDDRAEHADGALAHDDNRAGAGNDRSEAEDATGAEPFASDHAAGRVRSAHDARRDPDDRSRGERDRAHDDR